MTDYLAPPLEINPLSLYRQFVEEMEVAFPGWSPGAGNLSDRMAAAGSQIAAQLMEAASDGATNAFRFYGANIAGLPPLDGTYASGTTTWTATDTLGHTIPTGTVAVWLDGTGNRRGFETLSEAIIPNGSATVSGVPVRAVIIGSGANSISGLAIEFVTPLAFIASVELPAPSNGGTDEETDGAYLARLVKENRTLTPAPITPENFNNLLTSHPNVGRSTTIGGFNAAGTVTDKPTLTSGSNELTGLKPAVTDLLTIGTAVTGSGIPASTYVIAVGSTTVKLNHNATESKANTLTFTGTLKNGGYVASWVGTPTGTALEATPMKELEAELQAKCLSGVVFNVLAPQFTTVNVAATVFAWPGQSAESVTASVESAIKSWLSPESWGQPPSGQSELWNNDPVVRIINGEHAILQVVGTHYVSSLTLNAATLDVIMSGVVALPKLGTLAVTVNIG